ncbi:Protein FAR1-RELATED SEQUENCE 6 [Linum perenne]
MEEVHCNGEQVPDGELHECLKLDGEGIVLSEDGEAAVVEEKKEFVAPAVGMEFETYDDAYNYYSCYAKEVGFRVRVKNSWFKRNSREKYGAVLCCSSQGFKRVKDVNRLRKETRTGCPAMIRMRLVDSKRWRVLEVTLEHNHLLGAKIYKSVKKIGACTKRKAHPSSDGEVRTIKLYRALVIDGGCNGNTSLGSREVKTCREVPNQLNLKKGDAQAIYNYLCRMQLTNPDFFYLMDLNNEGCLRNVFWVDARSRASCSYFGDCIFIDSAYLSGKYEIPLPGETLSPFFDKYVHKQTPLKEFLDKYELALHKKHKEESLADIESRASDPPLKTRCSFELQLSKVYTRDVFKKFQFEVEEMYSCFSTKQIHIDGPNVIFLVKERVLGEGNMREIRDYEVLYNRGEAEVRCICSCFNFYGYLCRHALCVLNFNGVEAIPSKYVLFRWRKDYKRIIHVPDDGDTSDGARLFSQLHRSALKVVEEGVVSVEHYGAALQAFEESLNKVHEVEEQQEQITSVE